MTEISRPQAPDDVVDRIQGEWRRAYPGLDVSPVGILGRIQRIATVAGHRLERNLEPHRISRSEFDVLGALARAERPLRASEVVSTTLLSGASITKITESLARRGLLERHRSERDGRVVLLALTEAGRALVDTELPRRLADDEILLAGLTDEQRESLTGLLRTITSALGNE